MERTESVYILKDMELALLLSLSGMKELYGFKMNDVQNPDRTAIYQTLFELEKSGFLIFRVRYASRFFPPYRRRSFK